MTAESLLLELGVTSLAELGDVLRAADEAAMAARMDYRHSPGAAPWLDDALVGEVAPDLLSLRGVGPRSPASS
jgi:hypothetical protein